MTTTKNFTELSVLLEKYLGKPKSGKVRDMYKLPNPDTLLMFTSDRISIFDFVLGQEIPGKGYILNALNIFWRFHAPKEIRHQLYNQDLIAYGANIDEYLPKKLRNIPELQKRATVVCKLSMVPREIIFRDYMLGSILKDYKKGIREFCGHTLPDGLHDGARLPETLFTPTTKAESGHDENVTHQSFEEMYGEEIKTKALNLFQTVSQYCEYKGILLADTKIEVGYKNLPNGTRDVIFRFADELFTPDSTRYFSTADWVMAQRNNQSPAPRDKQFVRNWGINIRIDKKNPANPIDVAEVQEHVIPKAIVVQTQQIYQEIFYDLTSFNIENFWRIKMGIRS